MFSTLPKAEILIAGPFVLSSANAFNLVEFKILSFDRVNPLPHNKMLNLSKSKALAGDKINVT